MTTNVEMTVATARQIDLEAFERDGYAIVDGVLSDSEIADGSRVMDELLPPDVQPPVCTGDGISLNGRKQLRSLCGVPRLTNLAGQPVLVDVVEALLGQPFRLIGTSIPAVTYKSPPGHEDFSLGYHVDWPNCPPKPGDDRHLNGVLHFGTVEPGGGAFMIRPGSHRLVEQYLNDPDLRKRALDQEFQNLPGLAEPMEMCVPAGSVLFYHTYLVHDRSENVRDVPRKVLFVHYKGYDNQQELREDALDARTHFHPDQVNAMDERMLKLCGIR